MRNAGLVWILTTAAVPTVRWSLASFRRAYCMYVCTFAVHEAIGGTPGYATYFITHDSDYWKFF